MRVPFATIRGRARLWQQAATVTLILLAATVAQADSRVAFLTERLHYPPTSGQPDDFRVRTNAALALGAANDDAAVQPLCAGLSDPSEVVRQAVAVALRRLSRSSGTECLRRRSAVETSPSVKLEIQRAMEALEVTSEAAPAPTQAEGVGPPAFVPDAKYYVSLPRVANATSRPVGDVDRVVRAAIASKLAELGGFQLAPPGETNDAAKAAINKRRLKGYYLATSVEKFDYSDGNLRVRVKIAVFSYPGRDLRGEIPAGATLPGGRPGDRGAEDQLMGVVAARAAELFAMNFK
jgi:hypothetical protein